MLRFTICLALIGMATATGYMPSSMWSGSYGSNSYGRKYLSGNSWSGNYGLFGGNSLLMAKPSSSLLLNTGYLAAAPAAQYYYAAAQPQQQLLSQSYEHSGPIVAAVNTEHKVSMYDVPTTLSSSPSLNIEVPSSAPTVNFLMKSRSSNINVESVHEGTGGSLKETSSEDQPHINRHTVHRPIVQEVREIISPYRRVEQKINPVQEQVETIVPRGQAAYHQQQQQVAYAQPAYAQQTLVQPALVQPALVQANVQAVPIVQTQAIASPMYGYDYGLNDFSGSSYKPQQE
uniref:Uncharacterized protein LOC113796582 isoform X2 n=1 Tax=Dermatophagoides pteronyssinus TaxID=6956 RepID=A0A6P6YDB2_DERPT|nr:uncharacterized protein LOC113796582 isoform X2 [Dermatophagoides pteronyssinus]